MIKVNYVDEGASCNACGADEGTIELRFAVDKSWQHWLVRLCPKCAVELREKLQEREARDG